MNSTDKPQERLMPILITKEGTFTFGTHTNNSARHRPRRTPTDKNAPQMLTIREVAQKSGLSEYLIRRLCKEKKIKHIKSGTKTLINYDSFKNDYLN